MDNPEVEGTLERCLVVYSDEAKYDPLGLDRTRVEECDGVSEEVARAMARSPLERSRAELALAIAGFAGPQEKDEEVSLVYIAPLAHWELDRTTRPSGCYLEPVAH